MKRPLFLLFAGMVFGETVMLAVLIRHSLSQERLAFAVSFVLVGILLFVILEPLLSAMQSAGVLTDGKAFCLNFRVFLAGFIAGVIILTAAFLKGRADRAWSFLEDRESVYGQIHGQVESIRTGSEGNCQITLARGAVFRYMTRRCTCSYGCQVLGLAVEDPGLKGKIPEPGDIISCKGRFSQLSPPTDPGEFNGKLYYYSRGIHYQIQAETFNRKNVGELVNDPMVQLRRLSNLAGRRLSSFYEKALNPEETAMFRAMVLGDKSGLSDEVKTLYQENGVAHLLAVSGLHVSIVGGQLFHFLRRRKRSYGFSCACGALMILFYGLLTGMGSSVFRAAVMYCCYLLAQFSGLEYDLISAMGLAGILMLLDCPWRIAESGCIISFASIIGIGMVLPMVRNTMPEEWHKDDRMLAGPVLFMTTLPLLMYFYYEWSPWSLLLNMIVIPMMTPLMLSAVLGGVGGLLFYGAGVILCVPARLLLALQNYLLHLAARLPWSVIVTGRISWQMVVLIYAFEYIVFRLLCVRRFRESCAIILFMAALLLLLHQDHFRITMLDIGQGDCILLLMPDGKTMMIDGGSTSEKNIGKYRIIPALKYYGRDHLDYVSISHMDDDHISGVRELLESGYPIDHLILPKLDEEDEAYQEMVNLAEENDVYVERISRGDRIVFSGTEFICLHPYPGLSAEDRNDTSTVLYMQRESFDALFTGDLGEGQEPELNQYALENSFIREGLTDGLSLLKCAHHGSKLSTTEEFLQLFQPKDTIISAGKDNRYGHPSPETVRRLSRKPYVTAWGGAIEIEVRGDGSGEISYYKNPVNHIF